MTKIKLEAILATAALLLIPYFYLRSYQTKKVCFSLEPRLFGTTFNSFYRPTPWKPSSTVANQSQLYPTDGLLASIFCMVHTSTVLKATFSVSS